MINNKSKIDWNDPEQKKEYRQKYYQKYKLLNSEKIKKYSKLYYSKNKDKIIQKSKDYYNLNKETILKKSKLPYYNSYRAAKARCENPNHRAYKWYGAKGIKFNLNLDDFKFLWFRDKAYNMERPSIDRIDSYKNYDIDNCQFIELKDNVKKMRKNYELVDKRTRNK